MQMVKAGNTKRVPEDLVEFMTARGWQPASAVADGLDDNDVPEDLDQQVEDTPGDVPFAGAITQGETANHWPIPPTEHDPVNTEEQA